MKAFDEPNKAKPHSLHDFAICRPDFVGRRGLTWYVAKIASFTLSMHNQSSKHNTFLVFFQQLCF